MASSNYYFFFFKFLSRQQQPDQCFVGHKFHYFSQPLATTAVKWKSQRKVLTLLQADQRVPAWESIWVVGSPLPGTGEKWVGCSDLNHGFCREIGKLWGLGRCRSPVLKLWKFVGIELPLPCRFSHSTRARVQRGAREKQTGGADERGWESGSVSDWQEQGQTW